MSQPQERSWQWKSELVTDGLQQLTDWQLIQFEQYVRDHCKSGMCKGEAKNFEFSYLIPFASPLWLMRWQEWNPAQ